ncbi:alanine and arginine-rich domain-containing protein [Nerophis lumbriciformis]|uniref:alanine and arginine-rich domain-containing protein n=1 Tax=Nerophis lumbriciformis TaxID=546530 RepID=UPI002AE05037|nr:protein FAM167A-like [Nerophis lumbriciformis]
MDRDSYTEDSLSSMVLENVKNKLIDAFRASSGDHGEDAGASARPLSISRSYQANEELRRAQIDGAITWLRSELLEMRSQDLQLAQTLLGLNSEIQRLRRESYGAVEEVGDYHP